MLKLALFSLLLFNLFGCTATIPLEEHKALVREQQADYESRLRKTEDERKRAEKDKEKASVESNKSIASLNDRIEQLETGLSDKQRLLSDVSSQLMGLQDAFGKLSKKQRQKIKTQTDLQNRMSKAQRDVETKLKEALASELKAEKVVVESHEGGSGASAGEAMVVRFLDGTLFQKRSARLNKEARATLGRVAGALKSLPNVRIQIDFHTDNLRPAKGSALRDTWALTGQQGLVTSRALQKEGVDPSRFSYRSLGQYEPRASNDTEEGRQENRRVELLVNLPVAPGK